MYVLDMQSVAPTSSTQHALLGLLSICPMSGYDIRQMIPQSIGHFWSESYGQIYPALRAMAEAGLVEKRTEQADGKPDRHIYTLTGDGHDALRAWLEIPPRAQPIRNELLLKLFFGSEAPASASVEHVAAFLAGQQRTLATYDAITAQLSRDHAANPQLPFWLITLSRGRHDTRAAIAWARETLDVLRRQPAAPLPPQPAAHGESTHA